MSSDRAISVIICTWNRADVLKESLRSIQAQEGIDPLNVEVIVVDNNSTDNTRAVVQELANVWTLGDLRYEFEPRQGKQFALNRGVSAARFDVLAFTDDDILVTPSWLHEIDSLFADSRIDLVGGKTLISWPPSGRPAWYADDMLAVLGAVDLGDMRLDPAPTHYAPAGANLIARQDLFARVGGYSETHFRHMDFEFGQRCVRMNARVVYEPSIVVHAPVDEQCLTHRYFRRWAFKAGIARNDDGAPIAPWKAVPAWTYRQLIEDLAFLLFRRQSVSPSLAFSRELRFWRHLGTIASAWHSWFRPTRHASWIEKFSQKKNNRWF